MLARSCRCFAVSSSRCLIPGGNPVSRWPAPGRRRAVQSLSPVAVGVSAGRPPVLALPSVVKTGRSLPDPQCCVKRFSIAVLFCNELDPHCAVAGLTPSVAHLGFGFSLDLGSSIPFPVVAVVVVLESQSVLIPTESPLSSSRFLRCSVSSLS